MNPAFQSSRRKLSEVLKDLFPTRQMLAALKNGALFHINMEATSKPAMCRGQPQLNVQLPLPFELRRGLQLFAFIIVTPSNAKEMVWSRSWTIAIWSRPPKPLVKKTMTWQTEGCRKTVKSEKSKGSLPRFHACSVASKLYDLGQAT